MRGEVIEEYSRDFPAEIVETYSRPLPGAVEPVPTEPTPRSRRKKRRVWKGLLILLAIAAVIALLAAGVRWLIWELQMPDDWGEDDYYYYDQDQEDEDAPITIPTVEPDADARLELAKDRSHALSAQEVYRKVSGAVVTVAVDLDGGRMSVGTGVIFREDGYILTNHHVVAGGKTCTVLLPGGRPYAAKYIASDAGYDLAVLKINAEEALPFAEFGNSDALSVGDPVYAIGTPLDIEMGGTFTDGIVSSVNREIQLTSRTSMPLIQTNAALNNGNSGGPLIDSYGQVVGINFMKLYARYSTVEGLGFAIPSVQAERVDLRRASAGAAAGRFRSASAGPAGGAPVGHSGEGGHGGRRGGPGRRPGRGLSSGGGRQGDPQQCGSAAGPVAASCGRRDDVDPLAPRRDPDGNAGTD